MEKAKAKKLPPDPEGMNDDRAEVAANCIQYFQSQTGSEWNTAITDLLCDLMHMCDRQTLEDGETPYDFEDALRTARMHYEAETMETE